MRPGRLPGRSASLHPTRHDAVEHLYWLLTALDPERTVRWSRLEALAVQEEPPSGSSWRVVDQDALATLIELLRLEDAARLGAAPSGA